LKKDKKPRFYHQTNLVTSIGKNVAGATSDLDLAISHMIHGCGGCPSLWSKIPCLCMCWLTPGKYMRVILPTRTAISGPLLDVTFKAYYEKAKERLLKEAGMYGITVGRDGATIDNKCPLFNTIACSVSNPSMVLDVFDCSAHAAEGGKKGAEPKLLEIDPNKELIDLLHSTAQEMYKMQQSYSPSTFPEPALDLPLSMLSHLCLTKS
jgi:hypothetical protein